MMYRLHERLNLNHKKGVCRPKLNPYQITKKNVMMPKVLKKDKCPFSKCSDIAGVYSVNPERPTHFISSTTGNELLIKRNEARRHFLHAPYQLFVKPGNESKFYHFSGMFPINPLDMGADKQNEFRISDIDKPKEGQRKGLAVVSVDMFHLKIKLC